MSEKKPSTGQRFGTGKLTEKDRNNIFLHYEYDKRNRSLSSIIRIPKEFVPKLKPKRSYMCPSPIRLNLSTNFLPKEKKVQQMTKESELALSFDEDDLNEKETNETDDSKKDNEDDMNCMRIIMTRIRSNTINTTKDDGTLLNSKNLLKEYGNIATSNWITKMNMNKGTKMEHKKSICFWSMQKERASSILGFLEISSKESESYVN